MNLGSCWRPSCARGALGHPSVVVGFLLPSLAMGDRETLDHAIAESNRDEYGLTAGIYTGRPEEIEHFFDEIEAGVCYANKRSGATTGAWPGAQAFCGWTGSGSSGKGGCGPGYVQQFIREQSRTVMQAVSGTG